MVVEFEVVPVTPPARTSFSGRSVAFPSSKTTNDSTKSTLVPHSTDPIARPNRTFNGDTIHGEFLTFDKSDAAEFEFSSQSHLVILLEDGIAGGSEWSNGSQTGKLSSLPPNAIIFNPAGDYLRIRRKTSQRHCRMWLLSIDPTIVNRLDAAEVNVADLQFRQQIGIDDQDLRLPLIAIRQEIETPGLNSGLYIDTLLMVLLTRLMRCASNFAAPRQPAYVKGGLPNWRLKRALELFDADFTKTPSVAELAGRLQLHPTSFCRAFKQSTGLTPHRYLLVQRVNRAKKMMKARKCTLTEIALDCGFGSSGNFSVVFKRIAGVSPRVYRRSL